MNFPYEALDRSNFLIAELRERYKNSVLCHEKGSSIRAFNSVSIAGPEVVIGLNLFENAAERRTKDFLVLNDLLVVASSSQEAGNPPTDTELCEILEQMNSLYPLRFVSQCEAVKRLVIDTYPSEPTDGDSVAARVFEDLHRLLGGDLWLAPNYSFSDLYPNGTGQFWDDGRRIAELVFSAPILEVDLEQAIGGEGGEGIIGGDGVLFESSRFGSECMKIHLIGRQH